MEFNTLVERMLVMKANFPEMRYADMATAIFTQWSLSMDQARLEMQLQASREVTDNAVNTLRALGDLTSRESTATEKPPWMP